MNIVPARVNLEVLVESEQVVGNFIGNLLYFKAPYQYCVTSSLIILGTGFCSIK